MQASTSSSADDEAERQRQRGNDFFKKRLYNNAIDCYSRALDMHVSSVVLSNRAQAYLNLHKFENAYIDANEAVALNPNNVKALYRRAMALNKLGLKARARLDLEKCVNKDPQNIEAKKLFESLKNAVDKDVVDVTCFQKSEPIQSKNPLIKKHIQVV
ncbi:serine/threonine-protein phosphatase 5 [Ditylenchus destructor]|uniref:Serine/threonine-protein phosphatase 5 n=1 Tax=Ditylenchus destructor TaxID=166010 RepID=A0AAD4N9U0_9BILA|nr:serine/threonine-protein phosphatase 5 [Ditylenchus destructor]